MRYILHKIFKNKAVRGIFIALFWFAIWEAAATAVGKEVLLPSPFATFTALFKMMKDGAFYLAVGKSIFRVMAGYLLGIILGVLFAVASHLSGFTREILSPLKSIIKATPVASFIILAYMWLAKVRIPGVIGALIVVPIIWGNMTEGLSSVDKKILECADIFSLGFVKRLKYIYLPHLKPYFAAGAMTSVGLAWKSGIAAEALVDLDGSIGGLLNDSKMYLESADLFALTAVVILLSVLIEKTFTRTLVKKGDKNDKA